MKNKLLLLVFAISVLTLHASLALATPDESALKDMSYQAAKLQAELNKLQDQIRELKHEKKQQVTKKTERKKSQPVYKETKFLPQRHIPLQAPIRGIQSEENLVVKEHPGPRKVDLDYNHFPHTVFRFGSVAVISSPYIGIRSEFDASDLIVNISSINEDLRLIEQMSTMEKVLKDYGAPPLTYPLIELSGRVEALTFYEKPPVRADFADVDLGSIELATTAYLNNWALGFVTFDFDGTPPVISGKRVDNSRLYVNKGFLTLGNLTAYPVYTTWGQYYVPFGRYSSNMLSGPLPLALARTRNRAILLGYKQPGDTGVFAEAYVFRGDADADGSLTNGGFNLGYAFATHSVKGEIAASVIANITDSDGMQDTGIGPFGGFAAHLGSGGGRGSEALERRVPGADINLKFTYGPWAFITEYVTAVTRFNPNDLQFNGHGALPSAFNLEAAYRFTALNKPMSIAAGYGFTTESFPLNLSYQRAIAALNVSFLRNTIETLELRHDWGYPLGTTGAGRVSSVGSPAPVSTATTGQDLTIATLQVGVYF